MKLIKCGNVLIANYLFSPNLYHTSQIHDYLVFNRELEVGDLPKIVANFGEEILAIKNIRSIARAMDARANEEYEEACIAYQEICAIYSMCKTFNTVPKEINYGNTRIYFRKPRVVEFKDAS